MGFHDLSDVRETLLALDKAPELRDTADITILLIGGVALYCYGISYRETSDIDAFLSAAGSVRQTLAGVAHRFGLFFDGGAVGWMPDDWDQRARRLNWPLEHLVVWVIDEYGFIITKMGRWAGHDQEDVRQVLPRISMEKLRAYVREQKPLYIGRSEHIDQTWREVCEMAGRLDLNML